MASARALALFSVLFGRFFVWVSALKKSEHSATDISFESRRLPGYGQNGLPPEAIRVDLLFLKHQHLDRDMDKCVMQKSDNQAGFASHRGVHGIARIQIT